MRLRWSPSKVPGLLVAAIVAAVATGCGGESGSAISELPSATESTIQVTGTALAPSAAADIIGKAIGTTILNDIAVGNATCTLYNMAGESVGSATTEAGGTFAISARQHALRPPNATGATWTMPVKCVCANADGTV
ncbi:MAG: hypothetical protein HYV03_00415, partial [Deltaproteobacteria bacterium]|nr:hypothetical protein [Deltaproteobacteria bacterium]